MEVNQITDLLLEFRDHPEYARRAIIHSIMTGKVEADKIAIVERYDTIIESYRQHLNYLYAVEIE